MLKPLTVWITTNCGKFLKRWDYQTTLPASWEICMQVRKQQLELDMDQCTGSKLGKEYVKAVYCHPAYLTYRQSTSCKMLGWMKHKLESRLPGEILTISVCKWYHSDGRKRRTKRGEYKSWLKTQHSKTKDHGIWSHHGKYMGKKWKQWQTLFSWAPKSLWMVTAAMKLKNAYSLEGFPSGSDGKASVCNAGDPGSVPGLGRSPGEGNGIPLQYSCLKNPMGRGAW